ncbi:hypothetical protein Dsin_007750 [Dipteronia sinensis]|uniref:1-aminocyclopropane-1-carboxylate synthase n=1 Tax=Dipteronia sinensis TaxID=43782 RepID=A0AAE0EGS5_9ROSI|nr:hypothetical protein Dsin_007750 [Dipteronia sinensis]
MLSDNEFVDKFIVESAKRLATRYKQFTWGLEQVGIGCLKSNAGLFLWMDLHQLLKEQTFEAEMTLWRVIVNEVKLNVSPGSSFHCPNPGWFRDRFANMDDQTMEVALSRIRTFMLQKLRISHHNNKKSKKKLCWQTSNLRLSFSSRIDDIMISLCMSPHSPLAQSPLVRAKD